MSPDEIWASFKHTWSASDRERLIVHYVPLVKYIASRVKEPLPANLQDIDLLSPGVTALGDAIDLFALGSESTFEMSAFPRIRGAMLEKLRSLG